MAGFYYLPDLSAFTAFGSLGCFEKNIEADSQPTNFAVATDTLASLSAILLFFICSRLLSEHFY
jgi:hypothetical protein